VKSKLAKGYTAGPDGAAYAHSEDAGRKTDIRPQLCNPISEDEVAEFLGDSNYWLEEKFDGKRILIRKDERGVVGINRKGLIVGLPLPIQQAAEALPQAFILDGECIDDVLHVFDLLSLEEDVLLTRSLKERRQMLDELQIESRHLAIVEATKSAAAKAQKYLDLKQWQKEGVVFKRHDAPYEAGRPASGGSWRKFKFVTTGSFIVCRLNPDKRSVGLEVRDGRRGIEIGNVTIPPNAEVPKLGAIVEVRYLYAFKGGSLFQPVHLGVRDDLTPRACTVSQLKYRADNAEEES
jgi:bifunctional non-homologous end joining protein LigD